MSEAVSGHAPNRPFCALNPSTLIAGNEAPIRPGSEEVPARPAPTGYSQRTGDLYLWGRHRDVRQDPLYPSRALISEPAPSGYAM